LGPRDSLKHSADGYRAVRCTQMHWAVDPCMTRSPDSSPKSAVDVGHSVQDILSWSDKDGAYPLSSVSSAPTYVLGSRGLERRKGDTVTCRA
jgi:hypothetical protein